MRLVGTFVKQVARSDKAIGDAYVDSRGMVALVTQGSNCGHMDQPYTDRRWVPALAVALAASQARARKRRDRARALLAEGLDPAGVVRAEVTQTGCTGAGRCKCED